MAILSKLPPDVIDHVLLHLPDFETLAAVLCTSRVFYSVFDVHPHSIAQSIAWNVVGSALPQAIRVVLAQDGRSLPDEPSVLTEHTLTRDECQQLQDNAAIVCKYENLFSLK